MESKEIAQKLTEIHAAYVEKINRQPCIEPSISVRQSGKCQIIIYQPVGYDIMETVEACNIAGCLEAARKYIAALPDPDTIAKERWQVKLADVIDEGNGLGLPDDVMKPLHAGSQAMAKNLLTHQPESEVV